MRSLSRILPRAAVLAASILLSGAQAADEPKPLDQGRLDPSWFGPAVEFRTTSHIDYLWAKPGFSCKGKTLRIEKWPDPVFVGKERRGRDAARAFELAAGMPLRIRTVLGYSLKGYAEVTSEGGDLVLNGRLVDYVAKGTFGKSTPQATWDMKINDANTGELLVALHHRRLISFSTVEERIDMWLEEFGQALHDDFTVAAKGKPAKK
jgi:hypothetical protein